MAGATRLLVDAYTTFFSAVRILVETTLGTASTTEISAISNILILVNMQV